MDIIRDQIIICGGLWTDSDVRKTCLVLNTEGWKTFAHLLHQRPYHSSWSCPSGVRLLGGDESSRSSELVREEGNSEEGFHLEHSTQ